MAQSTLSGYEFTGFRGDLERLDARHPHVVRREPGVTYRDEFALRELIDLSPMHYEQYLIGWSRSYYSPTEHLKQIIAYGHPNIPSTAINSTLYQEAIDAVKNGLRSLPRVRALNVLTELDQVPFKQSSSAGYDYVGEKGPIGGFNHDRAIRRAKAVLWSAIAPDGEGIEHVIRTAVPDVGYTRTQLTELSEKMKVRLVWGRAFHYILLEGTIASPLLEAFARTKTFYHIGTDPTLSVPDLLSEVASQSRWIYAIDWKQFDATVSRFEINAAFDILKGCITLLNRESEACFEICRQLFIHKKVAAPDGYIYWSHKGIPSGSYFTSLIGSIVNRIRIEYLWRELTGHGPKVIYTQGDDSLCGDDVLILPERMAEIANKIGWFFNPSKTEYSRVPEFVSFLGRTYLGGINVRDLKKCLRLLVYPEYPVESGSISAYRAKSIAADAGNISELLNNIAIRLKRHYGVASEEDVPHYFKRYMPGM